VPEGIDEALKAQMLKCNDLESAKLGAQILFLPQRDWLVGTQAGRSDHIETTKTFG
jgi:hypothetical protein